MNSIASTLPACHHDWPAGLILPRGYIGLRLEPQVPRGPPANCGTFFNCRYMISSIAFVKILYLHYSWIVVIFHSFRLRVDNARIFQRVSMNLNVTVGQAACRLLCRYRPTQCTLAASCICWIVPIVTCESGEGICDCSCLKCTSSKLKFALYTWAMYTTHKSYVYDRWKLCVLHPAHCVGLAALSYNKNTV